MVIITVIFKFVSFILFCLLSGFTLTLGANDSNIKFYYVFTALCVMGVILIV